MNSIININKRTYDAIADQFSGTRDYLWDDLQMLEPYVQPNTAVADIGCGNGRLYQLFAKSQCEYTGIDQSAGLLAQARAKFKDATFLEGEMTALPLRDGAVDQCWYMASFHHLPTKELREKGMAECARVLKDGGVCIMLNWNMSGEFVQRRTREGVYTKIEGDGYIVPWRDGSKKNFGDRYYYDIAEEEYRELAEKSGLKIVTFMYTKRGEVYDKENGDNCVVVMEK